MSEHQHGHAPRRVDGRRAAAAAAPDRTDGADDAASSFLSLLAQLLARRHVAGGGAADRRRAGRPGRRRSRGTEPAPAAVPAGVVQPASPPDGADGE